MERAETKSEYIARAKASLRADLLAKSWPEKLRASVRMRVAGKAARDAMMRAKAEADAQRA
jgi:hypothetical protein